MRALDSVTLAYSPGLIRPQVRADQGVDGGVRVGQRHIFHCHLDAVIVVMVPMVLIVVVVVVIVGVVVVVVEVVVEVVVAVVVVAE